MIENDAPPTNVDHSGRTPEIAKESEEQSNRNMWNRFRNLGIVATGGTEHIDLLKLDQLLMDLEDRKTPKID